MISERRVRDFVSCRLPWLWKLYCVARDKYLDRWPGRRQRIFQRIFERNGWGSSESLSGSGSSRAQTVALKAALPETFAQLGIRRLLDVPCGDFAWMRDVVHSIDIYIGADIIPSLIDGLRGSFSSEKVSFE